MEELAAELAKFELGVSDKEMNETYTNVGFILNIIITSKMNENFYNFLFELKPIVQIDQYMKRFSNEMDLALRHNEHLSLIIRFLAQDAGELKNESEAALNSILKVEEFIKFLSRQETIYDEIMAKTAEIICKKEEENKIENEIMSTRPSATVGNVTQQGRSSGHADTMVTITINDNAQTLAIDKALEEVKKTREEFERHLKATTGLRLCMEALFAINEQNRVKIQRWRDSDVKRDN